MQVRRVGKRHPLTVGIVAGMIAVALYAAIVLATGTTADGVLGQLGFTHSVANLVDGKGVNLPQAVAIDTSATPNRVYVADQINNRVLGWRDAASFTNGAPADLVIGQPDFTSAPPSTAVSCATASANNLCDPAGVSVDGAGNLYVADLQNSRVLEYTNPFMACSNTFPCVGGPANLAFGHGGSFTVGVCEGGVDYGPPNANGLCFPTGVAVDGAGNLCVADTGNNRVLEYNTPLNASSGESGAGDTTADMVFGQGGSFTLYACNNGGISANSLCVPTGVAVDRAGNLYVVDNNNSRVLEYNAPLTTGASAALVFGQGGNFNTGYCDYDTSRVAGSPGNSSADDLCYPQAVAVDGAGNLYVADQGNSRVVEYTDPLTPNTTANTVFGQGGSFTSTACNYDIDVSDIDVSTANDLCNPIGVAVDGSGNVYVADYDNNRVLEYNTPLTTGTTADRVLGQYDFTHNVANLVDGQGLNLPQLVAIDTSATPNRVYVADQNNNRVLGWRDAASFINGAAADLVIGQPDFISYSLQREQRYGQRQQPVLSTGGRGGRVGKSLRGG